MDLTRLMKQTIVYWPPGTVNNYGNTGWGTAIELTGRWDDGSFLMVSIDGEKDLANGRVYLDGSESVVLDGRMYLGTLSSLTTQEKADPALVSAARRVVDVGRVQAVKAGQSLMKVLLR